MILGIAEIFAKVEEAETAEERVEILRRYAQNNTVLPQILRLTVTKDVPWHPDLPTHRVTYRPSPYLDQQAVLYQQLRKVPGMFFEGARDLPPGKREDLWVIFLESLDKDDARLMESIRLRSTLPYKAITLRLVREAFPGLLHEEVKA